MPAAAGQRAWLSKNGLKFRIQVARVEGTTTATPGSCSGALRLEQPVRGRRGARHAPRVSAARSTRAGRRPGACGFRTGGEEWPERVPRSRMGKSKGRVEGEGRREGAESACTTASLVTAEVEALGWPGGSPPQGGLARRVEGPPCSPSTGPPNVRSPPELGRCRRPCARCVGGLSWRHAAGGPLPVRHGARAPGGARFGSPAGGGRAGRLREPARARHQRLRVEGGADGERGARAAPEDAQGAGRARL